MTERSPITHSIALATASVVFVFCVSEAKAINYDMACVERYSDASGFTTSDNVSLTCDATDGFGSWFNLFGSHNRRFYWKNTLVWPRDYTEDSLGGGDQIESDRPGALVHESEHGNSSGISVILVRDQPRRTLAFRGPPADSGYCRQ